MSKKSLFYGYLSTDGNIYLAQYFSPWDIFPVRRIRSCEQVIYPFEAKNYEEANRIADQKIWEYKVYDQSRALVKYLQK